ncbi:MAG: hypothetical protein JWS10_3200 [Cypionkella sp.]|uniref:hypothetical protein n=1 Tax=Cypionkella sp. TaxID=2811411 RepID=UPI002604CF84|nr:hypothetical protein [Cypionkella sp.]MDB5660585.1 hypothetical protein [Cypionkella sp.]
MAEALSSTEIEDVLSSIRRLVSDDTRQAPRAGSAAPIADKLILTPALRVVQSARVPVSDGTASTAKVSNAAAAGTVRAKDVRANPPPTDTAPLPMFVAALRSKMAEDAPATSLGSVVASVSAAVDAAPEDWEAETGDAAPQHATVADIAWELDEADAYILHPDENIAEDTPEPEDRADDQAAGGDAPAAWAQQEDSGQDDEMLQDIAPVIDEPDSLQGTVEPDPLWADAAEASVIAALAEPDTRSAELAAEEDFELGMRFDEDVLRELVRDMLREELAGKMGERITRNIRKLVRAEIARALATQDFS